MVDIAPEDDNGWEQIAREVFREAVALSARPLSVASSEIVSFVRLLYEGEQPIAPFSSLSQEQQQAWILWAAQQVADRWGLKHKP